jgi:phage shock protein A
MNIFKRLFKIGQSEAHSLVDQLEDPIKLTEQGIRDMKADLDKSLQAMAEVKAMGIRAKNEAETNRNKSKDYEMKAIDLLERSKKGLIVQTEADRLAESALQRQQECLSQMQRALTDQKKFEVSVSKLDVNISKLKSSISKWENELKTLKARAKVSEATKNVNKQMANLDSSSTLAMLEKMKEKVEQNEALAESYAQIVDESKTIDEEIDKALELTNKSSSDALKALKEKMNQQELPPA